MTNKEIAKLLKLTASLLELHDENQFKIRTYTNAVFSVENQEQSLIEKDLEELVNIDGIGKGLAQSIMEIQQSGSFSLLDELLAITPDGILEMIDLKGLGPKKIKVIWKELNIETIDQLYEACMQGQLAKLKGFGAKTQETLLKNLEYLVHQRGKALYADAEQLALELISKLQNAFSNHRIELTGEMRRKLEIVENVEIIMDNLETGKILELLNTDPYLEPDRKTSGPFSIRGTFTNSDLKWHIRLVNASDFHEKFMISTGSDKHLAHMVKDDTNLYHYLLNHKIESEEAAYQQFDLPYIAPELREGTFEASFSLENPPPEFLQVSDLRGTIHNHSNYSDGVNTVAELADYCISQGYEYLGLSDHSKSAFYANGLQEYRIKKQHEEIDELNRKLAPFRIFKGIESDILNDGSLDYENEVLASFDFIVASVHSNLNMDQNKAMHRLLRAIENPYTTILGHPTGRLLLRRNGYPVDHKTIIDACAENNVIIEINANPWRLDLDWRWIHYALEKGVILSINPDAHEIEGFNDMRYGVLIGRKGGLTAEKTFNAWSRDKAEKYFMDRKQKIFA